MRIRAIGNIIVGFLGILLLANPAQLSADTAQYFYDPLGRLVGVVDGQGNVATYNYDAVGNLLSISRGTAAAPTIATIVPDTFVAGVPTPITITGTGLLFGSLTSSNSDVTFARPSHTATIITASITIQNPTAVGPASISIQTPGGSASVAITITRQTPTIAQISPTRGTPGTTVVIQGSGFGTKPNSNLVTFAGGGLSRLPATINHYSATSLTVQTLPGVTTGPLTVEVGGLTSNAVTFTGPPVITALPTPAAQGIPSNPGMPSANVGQIIQLVGGFSSNTGARFTSVSPLGTPSNEAAPLFNLSPDGSAANVVVPDRALTGTVAVQDFSFSTIYPGLALQIVPTITGLTVPPGQSVTPGVVVTISGKGFKSGATSVIFPGVASLVPATAVLGNNDRLTVTVPPGVTTGTLAVRTDGGTSNGFILGLSGITPVSTQGIPLNPAVASANALQTIQIQGTGLTSATQVVFQSTNDGGVAGTVSVSVFNVSADGTRADVMVPASATTGFLSIPGVGGTTLQIVPTLSFFNVPFGETYGPGVVATISGGGFKEGSTTVAFSGATAVSATDVGNNNGNLTVTVPTGSTLGPLTVQTDGGTSNALILRHPQLAGITGTAALGIPADPAQPSANVGQSVVLTGTDFGLFTTALLPGFDGSGAPTGYTANGIPSPDGTSLTVQIPQFFGIISGAVTVKDVMTHLGTGSVALQIVPTVTSLTGSLVEGATIQINGGGFAPVGTEVEFPGVASPVMAEQATILSSGGTQLTVVVPTGVDLAGQLTVITPGGRSNPFPLTSVGETEPNDTSATATLLVIDQNTFDVTKSATIDPAGDVDYYKYSADFTTFGSVYRVEVMPGLVPGPPLAVRLTWFDQDGVTVLDETEGTVNTEGEQVSFVIEPPVEGLYFFKVEEFNGQGSPDRTYQIRLSVVPQ